MLFFAISVIAGLGIVSIRGLDAWRALKQFRRTTEAAMLRVAELIRQMEERTAGVDAKVARLERAQAQLQHSLATAGVLAGAAGELYGSYRRIRSFMPRK
jgi:hypothetical protein